VLKRTYFMAVIDGVFCLEARVIYKRETLSTGVKLWAHMQHSKLYSERLSRS